MKFVINLAHRLDRYHEFCKNMLEMNMNLQEIKKFDAVYDKDFGGLGCAKSHSAVLNLFLTNSDLSEKYCVVFEDDFKLRVDAVNIELTIKKVETLNINWKVILLSGANTISFPKNNDELIEIFESQTASGYIVKREYIPILLNVINNSIIWMEKYRQMQPRNSIYHAYAIDQVWKPLQREGGWYSTNPMLGYQTESFSDIEQQIVNYSNLSS